MDCDLIYNFMLCKQISLIRTFDGTNKPHSYSGGVSSEWYTYHVYVLLLPPHTPTVFYYIFILMSLHN